MNLRENIKVREGEEKGAVKRDVQGTNEGLHDINESF